MTETVFQLVKRGTGDFHIVCLKHQQPCTLSLGSERQSFPSSGGGPTTSRLFNIECPKCGSLGKLAA